MAEGTPTQPAAEQAHRRGAPQEVPPVRLTGSQEALERRLRQAGVEPPLDSELDPGDLAALRRAGRAVRVSRVLHYHPQTLADVRGRVIALASRRGSITLAEVRDELGTSRKFAQALLEHLDAERVTIRHDDERVVRAEALRKQDQQV